MKYLGVKIVDDASIIEAIKLSLLNKKGIQLILTGSVLG